MGNKQDLVVIGGGAGGLVVTSVAAQLGLKVSLFEKNAALGGDCLHYGCVPSKTFIHAAKVASLMRHADRYGLSSVTADVDLGKVNAAVQQVVQTIQQHDDPERFRGYGADVIFSAARFRDPHTIEADGKTITSKRFVIATGSTPAIPPIPGLQECDYLTNETIFNLQQLPKQLIVLGGGAIGIELAQAFARLGSHVTVIEMFDQLLPAADSDVATAVQKFLNDEGITIHTATRAMKVTQNENEKHIHCEPLNGESFIVSGDAVLVATGRTAQVNNLGLDKAGVTASPRGIQVDRRLRTSAKHIYAVGDVVDMPYKLTHMAEYHAGIVLSNAVFHWPKKTDYRAIPSVVYCDPEIASAGLSEKQAVETGMNITIETFPFADIDRAVTDHQTQGFAKVLIHKGKLIGASIVGQHAGELIAELALAIQTKIELSRISETIHAYPTLAQINRRVVNSYYGKTLFSPKVKRIVAWLNRLF